MSNEEQINILKKQKEEINNKIEELTKDKSPAFSMKGYKLKEWFSQNKEGIKNIFSAGIGIMIFFNPLLQSPQLSASIGVIGAGLTKMIVDAIDFYLTDVKLN